MGDVWDYTHVIDVGYRFFSVVFVEAILNIHLIMSDTEAASAPAPLTEEVAPVAPLKPCCACPETKIPRDKCIVENGEADCTELIEAHLACMRKAGFKV